LGNIYEISNSKPGGTYNNRFTLTVTAVRILAPTESFVTATETRAKLTQVLRLRCDIQPLLSKRQNDART
jgi:hypothetical protein